MPTPDPHVCHVCKRRPVADDADTKVTNSRLEQLARDENPAIAHVASASIAFTADALAWDRLAGDPDHADVVSTMRKNAVVSRETARQLQIVAQDAKAVSTP